MIPNDWKITNFSFYLFVCFLKITIIISWRAQLLISGKPISQYASYSLIFSPLRSVIYINGEQHDKHLYNQSSNYSLIVKAHASFINLKVGVTLDCNVSLRFVLLPALRILWAAFQAKNNVRNAPASSALTLVSYLGHNTHAANHHLCSSGERNGAQSRTKVSFGRTMMQALELLQLEKDMSQGEATLNNEEIWQPLSSYTCLKALVSQSIS